MVGVQAKRFEQGFIENALTSDGPYFVFGPQGQDPRYVDLSRPVVLGQRWGTLMARFSLKAFASAN